MSKLLKLLAFFLMLLVLPFIILIRASLFFWNNYSFSPYFSIGLSIALVTILLLFYFVVAQSWLTGGVGNFGSLKASSYILFAMVLFFVGNGLFFISKNNVQDNEIRSEFLNLHPILRLSLSTLIYLDKELILTDAERVPEDYKKMGLKVNPSSKHYIQSDGYVHAVDLRTRNRSGIRNAITQVYFRLMGFKTLRHGGTGDHIHVHL